ncbi:hypothetical protein ACFV07_32935, partial [Streptomyces anulatus]|uniref:hypothetical protein n=1 Tax=Streptomyces anulatus TaxID=1892 RepID=UPI00367D6F65
MRISHPLPAPDTTRWGLVPLSLHQMTGTKATFSLREAHRPVRLGERVHRPGPEHLPDRGRRPRHLTPARNPPR